MLKQIQAKLEAKFPGLSKLFLGLIAAQMATKVTEESGIDAAIAELDNAPISITTLAAEFQKEGDRRVTEAEKVFKKNNPPKKDDTPAPGADDDKTQVKTDSETTTLLKTLLEKVGKLEGDKTQTTIRTSIAAKLKDKVPDIVWAKRQLPEKEEDVEAFILDVETDYKTFTESQTDTALGNLTLPKGGNGGPAGKEKASEKEVAAIVDTIM